MYAAYYGDNSDIGKYLMEAQAECFKHENDGIKLNEEMCTLLTGNIDAPFPNPILGKYTTQDDLLEIDNVLTLEVTTLQQFIEYTTTKPEDLNMDTKPSASNQLSATNLTTTAERYKKSFET